MDAGRKYYTREHLWIAVKDGNARIGITAFGIKDIGKLVLVDLTSENDEVSAGDEIAFLEGAKGTVSLYSPVDGVVAQVNEELLDRPELLNEQSGATYIADICSDEGFETSQWMNAREYDAYLQNI
jgi:glycine cleavage system H protein